MSEVKSKVLVVEDNQMNKILVKEILTLNGYAIVEASNGKEAVDMARSESPDAILMDINLPIMDGISATKLIKADEVSSRVPIIALTASAMKGDAEKFFDAGFDGYVQKPIDMKILIAEVGACIEKMRKQR